MRWTLRRLVELDRQTARALAMLTPTRPDAAAALARLRGAIDDGLALVACVEQGRPVAGGYPSRLEETIRQEIRAVLMGTEP